MTPVLSAGEPTTLSTMPWRGFGYLHEFDETGYSTSWGMPRQIDFEGIAVHLEALDRAARDRGLRIRKVILSPDYQSEVLETTAGKSIKHLKFNRKPVWVRHDDHYHVEFGR